MPAVQTGVAGAAHRDERLRFVATGPAVVDAQRPGPAADPATPPVPGQHPFAVTAEEAAGSARQLP